MFGIEVENPSDKEGDKISVWQNSWGLSTRVIGVMVMIHSDDRGLVLPPRVAETQVVIIPVGINAKTTEDERQSLHNQVDALATVLRAVDVRVETDMRDQSPGWKFNDWELRGAPLHLEFGPGESQGHFVTTSRRDMPKKESKGSIPITEINTEVPKLLEQIQADLYNRADETFKSHRVQVTKWDEFVPALNNKKVVLIPHCLTEACEDEIKDLSARREVGDVPQDEKAPSMGAKSLCWYSQKKEKQEKLLTKLKAYHLISLKASSKGRRNARIRTAKTWRRNGACLGGATKGTVWNGTMPHSNYCRPLYRVGSGPSLIHHGI